MRLNGWKRIGIVGSVVWILGAGYYTLSSAGNRDAEFASSLTLECEKGNAEAHGVPGSYAGSTECDKLSTDYLAETRNSEWEEAAVVAFVPVPLGWGFGYLMLFVFRWIKRGFMPAR